MVRVVNTNNDVLSIINLFESHEKTIRSDLNSIGNIYTIFFHSLVIHFSSILIQREVPVSATGLAEFPYVSKEFALAPVLVNCRYADETLAKQSVTMMLRKMQILPLAVGNSIPIGYNQGFWISKLVNLLGAYQRNEKVFVHRLGLQLDNLSECIQDICLRHSIPNFDAIRGNWLQYVSHHSVENLTPAKSKLLLIGNRQDLQNRKLAHNYLEQGKEVIAFTHGEIASTIFDEPMYRYAERGICSTLIEYGTPAKVDSLGEAMIAPKETLYRNSQVAASRYCCSNNITSKKLERVSVLYIPTVYVGNHIYGPFHAYPDSVYWEWHSAISRVVPSAIFKTHPKSRGSVNVPSREEKRWLDDCIDEYDVLILDYVATSTVLAMLTDKPVIFCDIGLRRLTQDFLKSLKERCHYINVDINGNLDQQLQEGIDSFICSKRCWSNTQVEKYCLSNSNTFRWRDIFLDAM